MKAPRAKCKYCKVTLAFHNEKLLCPNCDREYVMKPVTEYELRKKFRGEESNADED